MDIKPIKTQSFEWKQPKAEFLPRSPHGKFIVSGPSGTGKSVVVQNMILSKELYRGVYEKIYYLSATAMLDSGLRPICEYAEQVLKQDPEHDPCVMHWDEERLRKIIQKQKAAVVKAKKMNLKKPLPQILVVIDDLADNKQVVKGSLLSSIYISGRHYGCHCWVLTQRYRLLDQNLRTNANGLIFFRARNGKDVEAFEEENSGLVDKKTLHEMYDYATRERYKFLFINLNEPSADDAFYKAFDSKLVVE